MLLARHTPTGRCTSTAFPRARRASAIYRCLRAREGGCRDTVMLFCGLVSRGEDCMYAGPRDYAFEGCAKGAQGLGECGRVAAVGSIRLPRGGRVCWPWRRIAGYEIFKIHSRTTTQKTPIVELVKRYLLNASMRGYKSGNQAFLSTDKAKKRFLGRPMMKRSSRAGYTYLCRRRSSEVTWKLVELILRENGFEDSTRYQQVLQRQKQAICPSQTPISRTLGIEERSRWKGSMLACKEKQSSECCDDRHASLRYCPAANTTIPSP